MLVHNVRSILEPEMKGKAMIDRSDIREELKNCLVETTALGLPNGRKGKVRDIYDLGDRLLLITTDRQSAFDRVLAAVPFKGQVLNMVSAWWFERTRHIVPNHVISIPHPNATLARKVEVFPVEFVMRGYLTGSTSTSAWTLYNKGERNLGGNILPDGMKKNQRFPEPIITPTTKSDEHDESITPEGIVETGLMSREDWEKASSIAFSLFRFGMETARKNGLILVDTKYEMGKTGKWRDRPHRRDPHPGQFKVLACRRLRGTLREGARPREHRQGVPQALVPRQLRSVQRRRAARSPRGAGRGAVEQVHQALRDDNGQPVQTHDREPGRESWGGR